MINGKVVPIYAMKAYRGSRGIAPLILNLGTRGRWVLTSHSDSFIPGKNSVTHWKRGWWAPESVWTALEIRKCLAPTGIRTPDRPALNQLATPTALSRLILQSSCKIFVLCDLHYFVCCHDQFVLTCFVVVWIYLQMAFSWRCLALKWHKVNFIVSPCILIHWILHNN